MGDEDDGGGEVVPEVMAGEGAMDADDSRMIVLLDDTTDEEEADDRLWLAQPRLLGEPAIASVPLTEVGGGRIVPGPPPTVELRLGGRTARYKVLEDVAKGEEFVAALSG